MNETPLKTIPRNPTPGLVYGTIWLAIAIILGVLLSTFSGDLQSLLQTSGQRTFGFIAFGPFIALAFSILCFVRAAVSVRPYKQYLASTTPEQQHKDATLLWSSFTGVTFLILLTTLLSLGWLALLVVFGFHFETITATTQSLTSFVAAFLLLGFAAGAFLRITIKVRNAHQ